MLGRAAERFIRTKWASVQELAEELYATFSPDQTIQASQIIINQAANNQAPPFVINRAPGSSGGSIQINKNGGDNNFGPIDINGSTYGPSNFNINDTPGDFTFGPGSSYGGLNFNGSTFYIGDFTHDPTGGQIRPGAGGIDMSRIIIPGQDPSTKTAATPSPAYNPFILYGEVNSLVTGQTYRVNCWAVSPTNSAPPIGVLNVRFPMVDPAEIVPTGAACPVLCFPGLNAAGDATILDAIGFIATFLPSP